MTTIELAPQYDPTAIEQPIYDRWLEAHVFEARVASKQRPFVIVIPPPNVTDRLHMGHGLNNTVQDVLVRFERMRGRETCWLPGTDHAGIATQNVVERALTAEGKSRYDVGREAFVARVWDHVHKTGGTILEQLKAIGASCDWSRTRFTLDEGYSAAVRRVFVQLFEEGLIYRGHRVIHWCPRCQTALSDEEAEFRETDGKLYYIRYRVAEGQRGRVSGAGARDAAEYVTVATTRPETMFGDVAVVSHPDDERYTLRGRDVEIPLSGVRIPLRTHPAVEREFGTGMLKITPAHDANDFDTARDLDPEGAMPVVIDEHARMVDGDRVPPPLRGLDRFEARTRIVEMLREAGQLEKIEPHRHAVRHCYRCDTVIEPRLSDQWFVRMKPLAEPALEAYHDGRLAFVPDRWGAVYERWLNEIRDWNISRQLWWGHRIPAWYCDDPACGHITVSETDAVECAECGGPVHQDADVLDTWFSSWLWPFATFGWPEHTEDLARFYPGNTLVTGPDIIFFWVARMVMAGCHFMGEIPFDTVFLNGIVRDTQHQKMSKSRGNGIDPLDVVARYGADALRYTVIAGSAIGTDVILDPHDLDASFAAGRNFANKLWNVGRFILTNLDGTPRTIDALDAAQFELADRWILSRCQHTIADVTDALERYRLNDAAHHLYHFVWDDLADWYVEQVKPRLYGTRKGGEVARGVLAEVFGVALRLLHPIMPFITEALWQHLPGTTAPLLAAAPWPTLREALVDAEADDRFARVQALVSAVRAVRAEYGVEPGRSVRVHVQPSSLDTAEAINAEQQTIERLAKIAPLAVSAPSGDGVGAHAVLPDGSAAFIALGDAIDVRRECGRLRAERDRLDAALRQLEGKLSDTRFLERAPADVVARERAKRESWQEQRSTLVEKLGVLGC